MTIRGVARALGLGRMAVTDARDNPELVAQLRWVAHPHFSHPSA
jgi:hypothetical protein